MIGNMNGAEILLGGVLLASSRHTVLAQTDVFTRQVTCPDDPSALRGYASIGDLNQDMNDELARIQAGGAIPADDYNLYLCPGTQFTEGTITPVLDRVNISCGGPQSVNPVCIVSSSQGPQVRIQSSTVQNYDVDSVKLSGITFTGFDALSGSVLLEGASPATATFENVIWQVSAI